MLCVARVCSVYEPKISSRESLPTICGWAAPRGWKKGGGGGNALTRFIIDRSSVLLVHMCCGAII